ncbi:MAG: ABC transporter permease, partial [Myxococcaceae bacterium]
VRLASGNLDELANPNAVLLFEKQAERLGVKVGDSLTISAPTFRGANNTVDVTVVAIARDMGLLSQFNIFMQDKALRSLYQMNDQTTGALQLYLKDVKAVKPVQERLRKVLGDAGYLLMAPDPRAFFMKFESVNREDWTGQKIDLTSWDEEASMIQWMLTAIDVPSAFLIMILMLIICVGIMNIMWITIRERTREIGTLRAIGMQRTGVLQMFVTEAFLLGLAGTVAGAALGLLFSWILNLAHVPVPVGVQLFLMTDHLILLPTLGWVVASILIITGAITLVSIVPSFLAARMKPITAMHHIG